MTALRLATFLVAFLSLPTRATTLSVPQPPRPQPVLKIHFTLHGNVPHTLVCERTKAALVAARTLLRSAGYVDSYMRENACISLHVRRSPLEPEFRSYLSMTVILAATAIDDQHHGI